MHVLSLFDGISCGMVALERSGILVEKYHAYEIDKYATAISKKNYPEIDYHGDVFYGNFRKYKNCDLLIGGSPCTYWSVAKKEEKQLLTERDSDCSCSMFGHWKKVIQSIFCMKIITAYTRILKMKYPNSWELSR
jgi:cytosine-specific methyltransferase